MLHASRFFVFFSPRFILNLEETTFFVPNFFSKLHGSCFFLFLKFTNSFTKILCLNTFVSLKILRFLIFHIFILFFFYHKILRFTFFFRLVCFSLRSLHVLRAAESATLEPRTVPPMPLTMHEPLSTKPDLHRVWWKFVK